jgi:chorismate mutase
MQSYRIIGRWLVMAVARGGAGSGQMRRSRGGAGGYRAWCCKAQISATCVIVISYPLLLQHNIAFTCHFPPPLPPAISQFSTWTRQLICPTSPRRWTWPTFASSSCTALTIYATTTNNNRRLEDTITFHLIERVQFPLNKTIYAADALDLDEGGISLFDWMLREQERLQSLVRRYQSPDEYPFFPHVLQQPILQPLVYPKILHDNDVSVNEKLKDCYVNHILPAACLRKASGDRGESQENYGSAATCDVLTIQALSRRIHFGKFVAEAKFQKEPERFAKLIKAADKEGLNEAITNSAVERKVVERLRLKANTYGTDPDSGAGGFSKVDADAVAAMYKVCSSDMPSCVH